MDLFQLFALGFSLVAILISLWRFKKEITVIGPDIWLRTRAIYEIDADHGSLRERERWHYQFDILFHNLGDRNGLIEIDRINSNLFETIALMKKGIRHERQFPLAIPVKDDEIAKVRFGGYVYRFEEKKKDDTLEIDVIFLKKKKNHFWENKYVLVNDLRTFKYDISLLQPKRTKEGTDERKRMLQELKAESKN